MSALDTTDDKHYSGAEAKAAIDGLPPVYWLRLRRWATFQLRNNSEASADDVITAIYERFLDGSRRWPVGVLIDACFWEAVRSEISNAWDKHKRELARRAQSKSDQDGEVLDPVDELATQLADPGEAILQGEERARLQAIVDHIENSFKDDDSVTAVIIGRIEKKSPSEVQQTFGLTPTEYKSACKKLRRFLNAHYANGWKPYGKPESETLSGRARAVHDRGSGDNLRRGASGGSSRVR